MSIIPISITVVKLKSSIFKNRNNILSIDTGCSLTKVAYISKEIDLSEELEYLPISCALFNNKDIGLVLDWIKDNVTLIIEGEVRLTGVGGIKNQ